MAGIKAAGVLVARRPPLLFPSGQIELPDSATIHEGETTDAIDEPTADFLETNVSMPAS